MPEWIQHRHWQESGSIVATIDRTRNNGTKLIVQKVNTSVAQHLPNYSKNNVECSTKCKVVSSRTVNSFKNHLDKLWAENPPNIHIN